MVDRLQSSGEYDYGWRDGLYSISFVHDGEPEETEGRILAILREGSLIGSDEHGGVFEGLLAPTRCGSAACIAVSLRVPPGGTLITGERCGREETVIDIVGVLSKAGGDLHGICDIRGYQISVLFRYVGSLPH